MKAGRGYFINKLITVIPVLILIVAVAIAYDYYFDLNDDVLMKDILAGTYFTTPFSRNMQMLWPLSALVSVLYRLVPHVAWYGIMLTVFQYASIVVIAYGICNILFGKEKTSGENASDEERRQDTANAVKRLAVSLVIVLILSSLMLYHLVFVQYTITVAMMCSAAAVLLCTADPGVDIKTHIKNRIPSIVIITLAFWLRSEMTLLMIPFVGAAYVYGLSFEDKVFSKENRKKYGRVLGIIFLIMFLSWYADSVAYGSRGWKAFKNMFDSRTELYDYQVPFSYEGNERFYDEMGLSPEEAVLFENYNYGIDPEIDDGTMHHVASYAGELRERDENFKDKIKEKLRIYLYEITHLKEVPGSDHPWNTVALILYSSCILCTVLVGKIWEIWRIAALFVGRSAIWLYLLLGERTPDRITHSLYFIEITVLLVLFVRLIQRVKEDGSKVVRAIYRAVMICLFLAGLCILIPGAQDTSYQKRVRENINEPYIELFKYMADNTQNMYLIDTYSSVSYSEKMFDDIAFVSKANSNTLGGWAAGSPIEAQKLAAYGIENMEEGLLKDNVYFVKDMDFDDIWLRAYYKSKETDIVLGMEEIIADRFEIMSVTKMEN
ncbi:MAG: hypothetical protein K6A38_08140 [Lachnospiraceae bacterium]|nr:hypothetical protein [Lachnospiraceae bacterium]